jgi:hypothetical protein
LLVLAIASYWTLAGAQEEKDAPIRFTLRAEDLAEEFQKDAKAATKKYGPIVGKTGKNDSPKMILYGGLVKIDGKDVHLQTRLDDIQVVVRAKKIEGSVKEQKKAVEARGIFKEFKKNIVVIEADVAKILRAGEIARAIK